MKVRSDFVTNSSSSAFLLSFKKEADINALIEGIRSATDDITAQAVVGRMSQKMSKADALALWEEQYLSISSIWDFMKMKTPMYEYYYGDLEDSTTKIGKRVAKNRKILMDKMALETSDDALFVIVSVSDDTLEKSKVEHTILPESKHLVAMENYH